MYLLKQKVDITVANNMICNCFTCTLMHFRIFLPAMLFL